MLPLLVIRSQQRRSCLSPWKMVCSQKLPRGRPPIGAVLIDGQWVSTDVSIEKAAARLIKHRADCRERYRRNRDALLAQRPDLFKIDTQMKLDDCAAEPPPA